MSETVSIHDRWIEFLKDTKPLDTDDSLDAEKSPRHSGSVSPRTRKGSPCKLPNIDLPSQCIEDYEKWVGSPVPLDDIPEREWRLLAILARKRDEDQEREKLAQEFRKMWEKEKVERDLMAAKSTDEYKRYLDKKREQEKLLQDFRNFQRETKERVKTVLLLDSIRHKEKRSANLLNWNQDLKAHETVEKALEHEARGILAADRRTRKVAAEEWKRRAELENGLWKISDAQRKRDAIIKNAAKRVAISNALSSWEAMIVKQEALALEEYKRAQHAAHAELTSRRSMKIARTRAMREERSRHIAVFTQQLRDAVRMTR